MKTNFTKLLSVCFFLFLGYGAMAQDTRSVGETKTYKVAPEKGTNTLAWTVTGGGAEGVAWALENSTTLSDASIDILWMQPGTYTLTFTETEAHGGLDCATIKTATVTVGSDFDVTIADAIKAADCSTTGTNTVVTFVLTKTNGAPDWTFDYTTVGLETEISGTSVPASGSTHNLEISLTNKTDGADQAFKVEITNVKDSFGNTTVTGDDETAIVTIYGLPDTGDITFN
ncbi:hypothetical protein [Ancylomarina sp. 16SWW S1-10-2]|uniref:hypothetical protein n=1 Tax=Ancylomarina sp. 16SWW S1-10-2 TaxID=2499681 RepID=UPI0012AE7F2D|nr:hypothetical protein [Ancylomarina sp. 16SWW S1-10-2]MRT94530.1 hypothetical protein [Ancylomarina sp. 16SWW S1-10-2]